MVRVNKVTGVLAAVAVLITSAASAHENDLMFGYDAGQAAVMSPAAYECPRIMLPTGPPLNLWLRDVGVDFARQAGGGPYLLESVTWQQVSCTAGLTVGSAFGDGRPGFVNLTSTSPHVHFQAAARNPGTYILRSYLKNAVAKGGGQVAPSAEFYTIFVAGSDHALVDLPLLRNLPDTPAGSPGNGYAGVEVRNLIVSTGQAFVGGFYAQTPGRSAGIFVQSNTAVAEGDIVTVRGKVATVAGERVIIADSVEAQPGAPPRPLGITVRSLAGASMGRYTPGAEGGVGVSSVGLLMRVAGTLREHDGVLYLDDGSAPVGGQPAGVRLSLERLASPFSLPEPGRMVIVTGVAGHTVDGDGKIRPVLQPRWPEDIFAL
ncbi:MAG: hypothetical protein KatS3mg024_0643 [Armatimonadota bacterium]|nr:MAG: hypothetical protein KatS3mg024_0643 [Armatimonadota bacterium]